jgi:hypothetical protein
MRHKVRLAINKKINGPITSWQISSQPAVTTSGTCQDMTLKQPAVLAARIDCAQRLAPVDARAKAAMLDDDTWQDAFKRGILLADAKITPSNAAPM